MPGGYLNERHESVAGNETNTPTLSTKTMYPALIEFSPDPGTSPLDRGDELRDSEEPLAEIPEFYEPKWSIQGRAYPDHTAWRLRHILGPPTTTAGNGVITDPDGATIPVGAHRHVWKSTDASWGSLSAGSPANPPTHQIIAAYDDQSVWIKLKGAACEALTLDNPQRGGTQIQANGPALYMDDALADPALSPSLESSSVKPFTRGGLSLPTWLTGSGTHDDFTVNIAAPVDPVQSMGTGSMWADIMEKGDGLLLVTGSLALHQLDAQDIAALRASTGFAVKAKWLSQTVIASSYKHAMWMEGVNAQYISGQPAPLNNNRRRGATFDWKLTTAGSGIAATFTVVNATASYA